MDLCFKYQKWKWANRLCMSMIQIADDDRSEAKPIHEKYFFRKSENVKNDNNQFVI